MIDDGVRIMTQTTTCSGCTHMPRRFHLVWVWFHTHLLYNIRTSDAIVFLVAQVIVGGNHDTNLCLCVCERKVCVCVCVSWQKQATTTKQHSGKASAHRIRVGILEDPLLGRHRRSVVVFVLVVVFHRHGYAVVLLRVSLWTPWWWWWTASNTRGRQ